MLAARGSKGRSPPPSACRPQLRCNAARSPRSPLVGNPSTISDVLLRAQQVLLRNWLRRNSRHLGIALDEIVAFGPQPLDLRASIVAPLDLQGRLGNRCV